MSAGFCSYKELSDGTYSLREVFKMHDILDLQNWVEAESYGRAQAHGNN